jgi:DNA adenine methylase
MRSFGHNIGLPPTKPILKWAGGKSQLLPILRRVIPCDYKRYVEPFLGGGALFFDLAPPNSLVADSNPELIHFYNIVRDMPNELLEEAFAIPVTSEEFYRVRALDASKLKPIKRAARFLYLNKTCFNGLHRVNKRGQFNTPFCGKTNINIVNKDALFKASDILKASVLVCSDFEEILGSLQKGDFAYLDPPYWPLEGYADFKRYTQNFFNLSDHYRLAKAFEKLSSQGVRALLSNSCTPDILALYKKFPIIEVHANRQINSNASKRGKIAELLISNYPLENLDAIP